MKTLQNEYEKQKMSKTQVDRLRLKMEEAKMENKKERRKQWSAAIAAVLIISFALPNISPEIAYAIEQIPLVGGLVKVVTFRNYEYEDARYMAKVEVPELLAEEAGETEVLFETLSDTTNEINMEIQKITNELLTAFTEQLYQEQGYGELIVKSEILAETPEYFTLKLSCYQNAASGYEENYFYTIDLTTGERLQLKKLFKEGADYLALISENIKQQMQEQMRADDQIRYWLEDEMEELNFSSITDETQFYINEKQQVVISFGEGEVAPMYMGIVEFEIPEEVLEDILK